MNAFRNFASLGALAAVALVTGCTVNSSPAPTTTATAQSTLTVRWSIDGAFDPNQCASHAAPTLDVRILDQSNGAVYESTAPCAAFTTTIPIKPGSYTANATLVDATGHARTTTVNLQPFTLADGAANRLDADFPSSSFF